MSAVKQPGKPSAAQLKAKAAAQAAFKDAPKVEPGTVLRKSRRSLVAILIGILAVQVVSPATVILLVAGMLPSVVAYLVDTEPSRRSAHCVAVLNMAGVLPVLAVLWDRGATRAAAADILMDPFMWLLMYGAAGVAVLLLTLLPVLMENMASAAAEREIGKLEKRMADLIEEWGNDLMNEASKLLPGGSPDDGDGSASDHMDSEITGIKTPRGAARGRQPSSPSAASRRRGLQSGAPARG